MINLVIKLINNLIVIIQQRELLWKELKRRMKNGEFIYKEPNLLNP